MKNYRGTIGRQHVIDPRQMGLLRERCAGLKKGLLQYCCNLVWMKNGGLIPWSAIAICEMSKISWQTGKLLMKVDSGSHSKDQLFSLEQWSNIARFQHEINQDFINLARKFYQESSLGVS